MAALSKSLGRAQRDTHVRQESHPRVPVNGRISSPAREAAYWSACLMSSLSSVGYSLRISSVVIPLATRFTTRDTVIRIPRIQARPPMICGSKVIRLTMTTYSPFLNVTCEYLNVRCPSPTVASHGCFLRKNSLLAPPDATEEYPTPLGHSGKHKPPPSPAGASFQLPSALVQLVTPSSLLCTRAYVQWTLTWTTAEASRAIRGMVLSHVNRRSLWREPDEGDFGCQPRPARVASTRMPGTIEWLRMVPMKQGSSLAEGPAWSAPRRPDHLRSNPSEGNRVTLPCG